MKKHRAFTILFILLCFPNSSLIADNFSLSFNQNMTDNLFQNRFAESDQLSSLSFSYDKTISRFSFNSQGNYYYLHRNPNLTYYLHDLGGDFLYPINEKSALYFSLAGRGAFYRSDYSDFNYFSLNLFAAFKSYLNQTSILKSNYSFEYKNCKSSLFDSLSHAISASLDKYLQTKTTLKAELNWGFKYFIHPYLPQEIVPLEETALSWGGNGKGNAYRRNRNQFITKTQNEGQGIQGLSLGGLIAQGLGNNVGLRLSGMKQWILSGKNPFIYIEEYYMIENPSYDRFSWKGHQISSQLTVLIPWNIELKMGYTIAHKEFPGIESIGLEGDSLGITREDERKQLETRVEKNFSRFSLFFSYFYIDNHSNDLFFDWKGHFFSAGIEWNFSFGEKK